MGVILPGSTSPCVVQPVVQARLRIGAKNALRVKGQEPLNSRQKLIVESRIRVQAVQVLFSLDGPRAGQPHEVNLAQTLLQLNAVLATDSVDALLGSDKDESPIRRHDGDHVQDQGDQKRQRLRLDDESDLGCVVVLARVVVWRPVNAD